MTQSGKSVEKTQKADSEDNHKKLFFQKLTSLNALACQFASSDLIAGDKMSQSALKALCTDGALQEMIAAQMLSIHNLQQLSMVMANKTMGSEFNQYFVNSAVKLSNAFTQQASLLSKLQGSIGQRILVEHVEIHDGGQAVVGNVSKTGGSG